MTSQNQWGGHSVIPLCGLSVSLFIYLSTHLYVSTISIMSASILTNTSRLISFVCYKRKKKPLKRKMCHQSHYHFFDKDFTGFCTLEKGKNTHWLLGNFWEFELNSKANLSTDFKYTHLFIFHAGNCSTFMYFFKLRLLSI